MKTTITTIASQTTNDADLLAENIREHLFCVIDCAYLLAFQPRRRSRQTLIFFLTACAVEMIHRLHYHQQRKD
jgi:hypothetical protein